MTKVCSIATLVECIAQNWKHNSIRNNMAFHSKKNMWPPLQNLTTDISSWVFPSSFKFLHSKLKNKTSLFKKSLRFLLENHNFAWKFLCFLLIFGLLGYIVWAISWQAIWKFLCFLAFWGFYGAISLQAKWQFCLKLSWCRSQMKLWHMQEIANVLPIRTALFRAITIF